MGSSHSVRILMAINLRMIGIALRASAALRPQSEAPSSPDIQSRDGLQLVSDDPARTADGAWCARQDEKLAVARGGGLARFLEAAREARLREERVFVLLHAFAGPRREGDVECWLRKQAPDYGVEIVAASADIEDDSSWNMADP